MYKITRENASKMLSISTRSIDRYIRSGKLRAKKQGKIIYINESDINNFLGLGDKKQEVIFGDVHKQKENVLEQNSINLSKNNDNFGIIFDKLRFEITKKDEQIKDLSLKLGRMEEIVKNSVSNIEFKKTQFLLEESKNSVIFDLENVRKELENKNFYLKEEKKLNYILIITTLILFIVLIIVWLIKI